MKTRYFEGRKQNCDICHATDLQVYFDMPYQGGHWANLCDKCRKNASNPNHPAGIKWVKGKHPNADPPKPERTDLEQLQHRMSVGGMLESKAREKKEREYAESLSQEQIEEMVFDGTVECADGCVVEPDGHCPHGYSSPLIVLGIM